MPDINQLITDWGYAGIFLVVILGNIGLPVPEETVLAVAGYLVWSGRLQLVPVLIVALVSAVAGDNFGYWLGRHYGRAAVERYAHWLLKPGRVVVAESLLADIRKRGNLNRPAERHGQADALEGRRVASATRRR